MLFSFVYFYIFTFFNGKNIIRIRKGSLKRHKRIECCLYFLSIIRKKRIPAHSREMKKGDYYGNQKHFKKHQY